VVRVYGSQGSLEWQQHYPDYLRYTPKGRAPEVMSRGTGYISEGAAAGNRLPSGHPEGLYIAFANLYRSFIGAVIKKKNGLPLTADDLDFPSVEDGANGVRFVHAVVDSAANNSVWITL